MQRARRMGGPRRGPPARALLSARHTSPAGRSAAGAPFRALPRRALRASRAAGARDRRRRRAACSSGRRRAARCHTSATPLLARRVRMGASAELAATHHARGVTRVMVRVLHGAAAVGARLRSCASNSARPAWVRTVAPRYAAWRSPWPASSGTTDSAAPGPSASSRKTPTDSSARTPGTLWKRQAHSASYSSPDPRMDLESSLPRCRGREPGPDSHANSRTRSPGWLFTRIGQRWAS
jgi:hypothetical protein